MFPLSTESSRDVAENALPSTTYLPVDQEIFTCPNCGERCANHVDICAHLARSDSECSNWSGRVVDAFLAGEQDEDEGLYQCFMVYCQLTNYLAHPDDDLPSLVTPAEMRDDEQATGAAPLPPTSTAVPSDVEMAGITKVMDPNPSESFANLGGKNLLQQIEAGTGPEDPAIKARQMGLLHYPFSSPRDWSLGRFLTTSSLSQAEIDEFLKLERVCIFTHISSRSSH